MFWICIFIPGLISGVISIFKEKEISLLTTSFIGPALSIYSVHLLTDYYNIYLFASTYILLSLSGLFIQYRRYKIVKELKDFDIQYTGKK